MRKFLLVIAATPTFLFAQLYNANNSVYVDAGAVVFVDGDVYNDTTGHIKNLGDIYLTKNWINYEPAGALDPNTGKVWFDGNAAQVIKGLQTTTFNNLDCKTSSKKTLNINTIVGGNTGVLSLNNAPFDLNSKTLIVTNPLPAAITRTNGYIISETTPAAGYGVVEWRMGNTAAGNNYTYPFGTASGTYIPFLYDLAKAGTQSGAGDISVSTYPTVVTANPNNLPFPTGVTNLNDASGKNAAVSCLDRYWIVNANNYSANPIADVTFTYVDDEWDKTGGSTNNLVSETTLQAWKWSGSAWQNPPVGTDNATANTVKVTGVSGSAPWTLKGTELICGDFWLPDAFSPNGDGHNEVFVPRNNCIKDIDLKIFNRWGNIVFETTTVGQGWDGSVVGKSKDGNEGVYAYQVTGHLEDGKEINQKGTVTLMK